MFKTTVGPGSSRAGYLRPETAQGIFMDFNWISRYFRGRMPFGVVQIGKAYRNEISPRQALLRLREFHQMEAEVFFDPQNKTWPRYDRLRDKNLKLLTREAQLLAPTEQNPIRMTMGDAVANGIIANEALGYFVALTAEFLETAGLPENVLRFRQHGLQEKAHYATDTWDAEFLSTRFDWVEIVGIADRTDFDLRAHERVSGQKLRQMRFFKEPQAVEVDRFIPVRAQLGPRFKDKAAAIGDAISKMDVPDSIPRDLEVEIDGRVFSVPKDCVRVERRMERKEGDWYVPHVIEPSFGVDRIIYALLECNAEFPGPEIEMVSMASGQKMQVVGPEPVKIRLPQSVAPIKAGVFPLMNRDGLDMFAKEVDARLRAAGITTYYDDAGAIGRRYARMDEIGTPWCVTVDYDSLEKKDVTVRERDTTKQERVAIDRLVDRFHDKS
jgi:glycyl-tRNA synthetase